MKTIKRRFKNEGLTNNENCSVFDNQLKDIETSREKFNKIMQSKLVQSKENAGVKDVKTSNVDELTKRGKEMRRQANIKESKVLIRRNLKSKSLHEGKGTTSRVTPSPRHRSMMDVAKEVKLTSDKIFEIVDHDLNGDGVAIQVDNRVFICEIEDLPKGGVPSNETFKFKGCEVTSNDIEKVDGKLMMQDCGEEKSYEVINGKIVKEKLTESPMRNLEPRYDSRKSFYGKARVETDYPERGSKVLYSYSTPVVGIRDGKVTLLRNGYLGWASSSTTLRHVKDFLRQEGFASGSYKELMNMYPVQQFDDWKRHKNVEESVRHSRKFSNKVNEDADTDEKVSFNSIRKWLKTSGATIEAETAKAVNYDEGYEISFYGDEKKFENLDLDSDEDIKKVLDEVNKRLASPKHPFIGLWAENNKDVPENKDVYVDYSEHFMGSEKEALKVGAERQQKSILRWSDMEFLYTDKHSTMKESKIFTSKDKEKLTGRVLKKQEVIEDSDSCVDGEPKKLTEGYIGQTLEDFLGVCVEPDVTIQKIVLCDINEDDFDDSICFNGTYDELTEAELNYEFHEFDTFGEGVTINVGVESGDDYYSTVSDFLEDCNEDKITIYDLDKDKVVFEGDKYEIPDDVLDMEFTSFDAPKKIAINVTCSDDDYEEDEEEFDSYDEDDSFDSIDESLKITSDISSYEPWSGAVETFEKIKDAGMIDDLDFLLEDIYPDGITETQLNDILWFDADWVLESLGLKDEELEEDDYE